ncbi:MAG: helix-turn-helix transcriptional regulator [Thermoanaerobaculia bacterium]|nr:helix-turn-helix transcriptional regulator [Thermoanaerobaculia bacterium]
MVFVHKTRQVQLVGPKIRQLRKERKLTQTELAARISIQQSDLSRMEKGEYRVSLDTLFRILAEFDVSISEFFDDLTRETMTPRDVQLMRDLQDLGSDARREVEDFVAFKRTQGTAPSETRLSPSTNSGNVGRAFEQEPRRFERS